MDLSKDINKAENSSEKKLNLPQTKMSWLSIVSFCLALFPWIFRHVIYTGLISNIVLSFILLSWPLSILAGIFAMIIIRRKNKPLKGTKLAIAGITISIASLLILIAYYNIVARKIYEPMEKINACRKNMSTLRDALKAYTNKHDGRIPASQWCDELITKESVLPETFICPTSHAKTGQSSYALNKNIVGMKLEDIPRDVVLLFETQPGWNQVGGPELFTTENHQVTWGKYGDVICIRGRAKNLPEEEIYKLRWKP